MEKPDMNPFCDKWIRDALNEKANEIIPSGDLLYRINSEIEDRKQEDSTMNKVFKSRGMKPVVIATLVLILTAATSFAASQISSLQTMSTDSFGEFPTPRQVEKAVNYAPDYVESFSNGFYFKEASIHNTQALDGDSNKVMEYKGITFHYTDEKDAQQGTPYAGHKSVSLTANLEVPGLPEGEIANSEESLYGEIKLVYSKITDKLVPEGYVITEEEQQKIDRGEMWISTGGGDEIEVSDVQFVTWTKDGIAYNLMDMGCCVEKSELLEMAREIIR